MRSVNEDTKYREPRTMHVLDGAKEGNCKSRDEYSTSEQDLNRGPFQLSTSNPNATYLCDARPHLAQRF
jgi:hypothetical protein